MIDSRSTTSDSIASPAMACARRPRAHRTPRSRGGFTLLEVLIATAVTLLMMLSLSQIF